MNLTEMRQFNESWNNDTEQFDVCKDRGSIAYIVVLIILMIFTFVGNGLTIASYMKDGSLRKVPFNMFIVNLAVADFLVGVSILAYVAFTSRFVSCAAFSILALLVLQWCLSVPIILSVCGVLLMTVDRLRMVRDPIKYKTRTSNKGNLKQIVFVCIVGALYPFLAWVITYIVIAILHTSYEQRLDATTVTSIYLFTATVVNFLVPLASLVLMNCLFIIQLSRRLTVFSSGSEFAISSARNETTVSKTTTQMSVVNTCDSPLEGVTEIGRQIICKRFEGKSGNEYKLRKVSFNLLLLVSIYLLCWVPLDIVNALEAVFPFYFPQILKDIVFCMFLSNSAINPVIYAVINPNFRNAMIKVILPIAWRK